MSWNPVRACLWGKGEREREYDIIALSVVHLFLAVCVAEIQWKGEWRRKVGRNFTAVGKYSGAGNKGKKAQSGTKFLQPRWLVSLAISASLERLLLLFLLEVQRFANVPVRQSVFSLRRTLKRLWIELNRMEAIVWISQAIYYLVTWFSLPLSSRDHNSRLPLTKRI